MPPSAGQTRLDLPSQVLVVASLVLQNGSVFLKLNEIVSVMFYALILTSFELLI